MRQRQSKDWIPACAAERHSHDTNMLVGSTPQERPWHGKKVLGGLEEQLASWTKGCEGQKGSGE